MFRIISLVLSGSSARQSFAVATKLLPEHSFANCALVYGPANGERIRGQGFHGLESEFAKDESKKMRWLHRPSHEILQVRSGSTGDTSLVELKRNTGACPATWPCTNCHVVTNLVLFRVVDRGEKLARNRLIVAELLTDKLCHQWIEVRHRRRLDQQSVRQR